MSVDYVSFILGFLFCMVADVVFSISNYYLRKAFGLRYFNKKTNKPLNWNEQDHKLQEFIEERTREVEALLLEEEKTETEE